MTTIFGKSPVVLATIMRGGTSEYRPSQNKWRKKEEKKRDLEIEKDLERVHGEK